MILFCLAAPASWAVTCPSASSLRPKVEACEDNLVYAKAGKACVEAYEKEIAAEKEKVAKALSALASKSQQSSSLEGAKKSYEEAIQRMKALAGRGVALSAQVAAYKNEVVWPEDTGSAAEAGFSAETIFGSQSCYSETQKLIKQYSEIIALDAKQLALTGGIAGELSKRALKGEASLKNKDLLPLLDPKTDEKSGKAAPVPAGSKQTSGKSDITGTDKDKKK